MHETKGVLAADRLDHILRWSAQELGDDGKLIDVVLAGEQRFALEHFCEDTACAPDIDLDVVFLPCKHDLRRSIVSCRHIARHLRILDSCKTKVANLQVAVLVHEDVAGLEVAMYYTGRMNVFQASEDLVKEVLDELLFKRS